MSYAPKWLQLRARIVGLVKAGQLYATFTGNDSFRRDQQLRDNAARTLSELERFGTDNRSALPAMAFDAIADFSNRTGPLLRNEMSRDMAREAIGAALVAFASLEAELSYLLADTQESIRGLSARAFKHLQRQIVADTDVRTKWQRAHSDGEVACEKLGSVHLLSHGIFAFKASAEGERTDLVFNDSIQSLSDIQGYADGVVLTEWKVATPASMNAKIEQARSQASRYQYGVLGGLELVNYRYIVVVSDDFLPNFPGECAAGNITYRQVNIAVNPSVPSRPIGRGTV